MAGQPQEPSWQPGAQDQARAAWPQPSFTPPTGSPQDTFAFPAPVYGQPGQAEQPGQPGMPGQGYPPPTYNPQDQAYNPQEQAYNPQGQGYSPPGQAYNPQGQGQAQGMPQWQAAPGIPRSASSRPRGEKGFVGSLFDFSFNSMVTPKIIKVLYVLITAWVALLAIVFLIIGFKTGGAAGGIFTLIIFDPILVLLSLGAYRIVLELCMVVFKLHEDVKAIRAKGEEQG